MERQLLKKTILKKIKLVKSMIVDCKEESVYKTSLEMRLKDLEEINQICKERNRY